MRRHCRCCSACCVCVLCGVLAPGEMGLLPNVGHTGTCRRLEPTERRNPMADRRTDVAPCGSYCAGCLHYLALVRHDGALLINVAAAIKKKTDTVVSLDQVGCEGCWGTIHHPWSASLTCRIRRCVSSSGFATCAECQDFSCDLYLRQFDEDSEQARNIRAIRAQGVDAWLAGKKQSPQSIAPGDTR